MLYVFMCVCSCIISLIKFYKNENKPSSSWLVIYALVWGHSTMVLVHLPSNEFSHSLTIIQVKSLPYFFLIIRPHYDDVSGAKTLYFIVKGTLKRAYGFWRFLHRTIKFYKDLLNRSYLVLGAFFNEVWH